MGITVNKEWLKEVLDIDLDKAFKIVFLFTNDADKAEALTEGIFINLVGESEFESERYFEMWLLRQAVNAGKKAQLINNESITNKVLLLDKNERLVFHLHNYFKYSIREISGILKKSEVVIGKWLEEAEGSLGSTEEIKLIHKEFFDKLALSDKLKERMNKYMETDKLIEVKTESDLQKERGRKICWIASLVLIGICLIVGSGVF